MLKIRHYSFSTSGGAGRVAQQLNSLQMNAGIDSRLFTTTDGDIRNVYRNHPILFTKAVADFYLVRNDLTNPLFSLFRNGTSIEASVNSKSAKVVNHFHWTCNWMWFQFSEFSTGMDTSRHVAIHRRLPPFDELRRIHWFVQRLPAGEKTIPQPGIDSKREKI